MELKDVGFNAIILNRKMEHWVLMKNSNDDYEFKYGIFLEKNIANGWRIVRKHNITNEQICIIVGRFLYEYMGDVFVV